MTRTNFLLLALLAGCQAEPRSASYFEAHADDAKRVVEACRDGRHRGRECETAPAGLAAQQANRRLHLFKKSFE